MAKSILHFRWALVGLCHLLFTVWCPSSTCIAGTFALSPSFNTVVVDKVMPCAKLLWLCLRNRFFQFQIFHIKAHAFPISYSFFIEKRWCMNVEKEVNWGDPVGIHILVQQFCASGQYREKCMPSFGAEQIKRLESISTLFCLRFSLVVRMPRKPLHREFLIFGGT